MPYAKMARISNFQQLAAQRMNGRPAQRNDHCRADTPDFRIEPDAACVDVFLRRRFVNAAFAAGLPAKMLDDVGKEDCFDREPRLGDRGAMPGGIAGIVDAHDAVAAAEQARMMGMTVISLTGDTGGKLKPLTDILLNVPSTSTPIIQQGHLCLYHYLCEVVEARLSDG